MDSMTPKTTTAEKAPVDLLTLPNMAVNLDTSHGFAIAQRVAGALARSTLVPTQYQGNVANCLIALNMAHRLAADPLMVIQNLYIVHGRPAWSAQFLIAVFNRSGRFSPLTYKKIGTEGQDSFGYIATSRILETGEILEGTPITIGLAKANGWWSKKDRNGNESSKWPLMTDQMLRLRAAAWFVRAYAPELVMGIHTDDEIRESFDGPAVTVTARGSVVDLNDIIDATIVEPEAKAEPATVAPVQDPEPVAEPVEVEPPFEVVPEAPKEVATPAEPVESKPRARANGAEMDGKRADLVAEIEAQGVPLADVEKEVNKYSKDWGVVDMAKVRGVILPKLLANV